MRVFMRTLHSMRKSFTRFSLRVFCSLGYLLSQQILSLHNRSQRYSSEIFSPYVALCSKSNAKRFLSLSVSLNFELISRIRLMTCFHLPMFLKKFKMIKYCVMIDLRETIKFRKFRIEIKSIIV